MYYLPLVPATGRYLQLACDSFWCCTGTGAEEFAKFADTIYFHDDDGVYVNLYIASELNGRRRECAFGRKHNSLNKKGAAHHARNEAR